MKLPSEYKIIDKKKGRHLVVFPMDPSVTWMKDIMVDILNLSRGLTVEKAIERLAPSYSKKELSEVRTDFIFLKNTGFLKNSNPDPWSSLSYTYKTKPSQVWLNLTNRCNFSCPYCYSSSFRKKRGSVDMDPETAKNIIDWSFKVNRNNPRKYIKFVFFGGEPLLNVKTLKFSLDYINYRQKKDDVKIIESAMFTNGSLLNKKTARILKKYGVFTRITIHRKKGKAIDQNIVKKINVAADVMRHSNMIINHVIAQKKDLKDIINISGMIKNIVNVFSFDFKLNNKTLSSIFKKFVTMMKAPAKSKLPNLVYGDLEMEMFLMGRCVPEDCGAAQSYISFFPNGDIYPCSGPACSAAETRTLPVLLGNINRGGIKQRLYEDAVKLVKNKSRKATDCMKCWVRAYCRGPCKYGTGEPSVIKGKNPLCDSHRFFKEYFIRIFADMSSGEIISLLSNPSIMQSSDKKYKDMTLLMHLRDLQNKQLKHVEVVTPIPYRK